MTIIAYYKGSLYSDRIHEGVVKYFTGNTSNKSKIHINEDRTIAFCSTGLEINVNSLPAIFSILQTIIELDLKLDQVKTAVGVLLDQHVRCVLEPHKRKYLVITKNRAYFIFEDLIINLDEDDFITDGLEGDYFRALVLAGKPILEVIPHIYDNLSKRTTKEFDFLEQQKLNELKFIHQATNNNEAIDKLTDNLNRLKGE